MMIGARRDTVSHAASCHSNKRGVISYAGAMCGLLDEAAPGIRLPALCYLTDLQSTVVAVPRRAFADQLLLPTCAFEFQVNKISRVATVSGWAYSRAAYADVNGLIAGNLAIHQLYHLVAACIAVDRGSR
jgi:hypothetical protein